MPSVDENGPIALCRLWLHQIVGFVNALNLGNAGGCRTVWRSSNTLGRTKTSMRRRAMTRLPLAIGDPCRDLFDTNPIEQ